MFLGYHGRKGPKKDHKLMATTMKAMAYNIKCPTFISKFYYERNP